ncbi:MAG: hypothetical protein B7Z78_10715 [Rhodospirillales bacterium 20-60-12]|nr:MAG: hypothetical protein B7Z78_10715 [Rhodospirillales bacterium 20-60-12]
MSAQPGQNRLLSMADRRCVQPMTYFRGLRPMSAGGWFTHIGPKSIRPGKGRQRRRAAVTAIVGLAAPVLIGFMGFVVDIGSWYGTTTNMQTAADAGAMAAARLLNLPGTTLQTIQNSALAAAQAAIGGTGAVSVVVTAETSQSVTITAQTTGDRLFSALFLASGPNIGHSATATLLNQTSATGCVVALNKIATKAVDVENMGRITASQCGVFSDSNATSSYQQAIYVRNGTVAGLEVGAAGGIFADPNGSSVITGTDGVMAGSAAIADPFAALSEPSAPPCQYNNVSLYWGAHFCNGNQCTLPAGSYCGGLTVSNGVSVTFTPDSQGNNIFYIENGDFVITGGATVNSSSGVSFYLGGQNPGRIDWENYTQTSWNFSAPTTGPLAGVLVFQSRDAPSYSWLSENSCGSSNIPEDVVVGGSGMTLNGAIYAPSANFQINNDAVLKAATGGTLSLVANTVTVCGSAQLQAAGSASSSGAHSGSASLVALTN